MDLQGTSMSARGRRPFVTTSSEVGSSPCLGGARCRRSSSHHRSTFHFPFVLSCLPTHLVSIPSLNVVYLPSVPPMSLCRIVYCKCMCTFSLVRDGLCTHLFVVLVSGAFMNNTAPLITQFCSPAPVITAASYALPYTIIYHCSILLYIKSYFLPHFVPNFCCLHPYLIPGTSRYVQPFNLWNDATVCRVAHCVTVNTALGD
jgi:hypothetical protein